MQLSALFAEWLMGLPAGHVTDVPGLTRNDQLHVLGNGAVSQQVAAAVRYLIQFAPALNGRQKAAAETPDLFAKEAPHGP